MRIAIVVPRIIVAVLFLAGPALAMAAGAQAGGASAAWTTRVAPLQDNQSTLRSMSLEELMNLEVTTVSKTSENLFRAPAAVYVITADEIRRSGLRSVPELLRLVPGLEVASIDANKWAITSRGFNGRFANKLLVMIDGRTVYTPLFSGVFWDVQNVPLEDIDRIEVIRGPGGTLWGANAVNGVISIITKSAGETGGWFAEGGVGTEEQGFAGLRYGGGGGNFDYRFYGRFFNRDAQVFADGSDADDDWQMLYGGARLDWSAGSNDVSLSGELYDGEAGQTTIDRTTFQPVNSRTPLGGGHALGEWDHRFDGGSSSTLRFYYDRARRTNFDLEKRDTFDIDFQHVWPAHARHEVVWGAGYRVTKSSDLDVDQIPLGGRTLNLYSFFAQDQISLSTDWTLVAGAKFEHNDFTGFEVQPNVRISWSTQQRHTVWGAVSRAVRTPSEGESDARILLAGGFDHGSGIPIVLLFEGNPDLEAEKLIAYEGGFRTQPVDWFSLDVAAFYNDYDDIIEATALNPIVQFFPPPPRIIQPIVGANVANAASHGLEISSRWQAHSSWQLGLAYSYFQLDLEGAAQLDQFDESGASPAHQFKFKSNLDLPRGVELDTWLYVVGKLAALDVDAYARLDVRVGWHAGEHWELSVVGQNLLQAEHYEFVGSVLAEVPTQVQRSVYGMVQWRY